MDSFQSGYSIVTAFIAPVDNSRGGGGGELSMLNITLLPEL